MASPHYCPGAQVPPLCFFNSPSLRPVMDYHESPPPESLDQISESRPRKRRCKYIAKAW